VLPHSTQKKKQPKSASKIQPKNGCIDDAMIYVHAKFGVAQILCKEGKKKDKSAYE